VHHGLERMFPAGAPRFFRDQRLNAEAHAIHAAPAPGLRFLIRNGAGSRFESYFGELARWDQGHYRSEQAERHEAGRAPAPIHGFRHPGPHLLR
jgi:hypothetical protein